MDDGWVGWDIRAQRLDLMLQGFKDAQSRRFGYIGGFFFDHLETWLIHSVGWNTREECTSKLKLLKKIIKDMATVGVVFDWIAGLAIIDSGVPNKDTPFSTTTVLKSLTISLHTITFLSLPPTRSLLPSPPQRPLLRRPH